MKMIKCAIIDDDPLQASLLGEMIKELDQCELDLIFNDPVVALQNKNKLEAVDVLFLDVEMPKLSGLELIERLGNKPQIILVTSKKEYAIPAFKLEVFDYLVKPVSYLDLTVALERYSKSILKEISQHVITDQLFVKCHSTYEKIVIDEILVIRGADDYLEVITSEKKYLVYSTMANILLKLPEDKFMRVHRSSVVNLSKIQSLDANVLSIEGELVNVSKTYLKDLVSRMNVL